MNIITIGEIQRQFLSHSGQELDEWIKQLDDREKTALVGLIIQDDTTRPRLLELVKQEQDNYIRAMEKRMTWLEFVLNPNPWVNVGITTCNKPQSTSCFRLEDLPTELIIEVVGYLPRDSAGALASVNKNLQAIVNMARLRPLSLCRFTTFKYLQLLERDLDPDMFTVACPVCLRLHSAYVPKKGRGTLRCPHPPCSPDPPYNTHNPATPSWLKYNFIRAVSIQKARGREGAKNCAQLLEGFHKIKTFIHRFVKAIFATDAFFTTGGELIIQDRIVIAPYGDVGRITEPAFCLLFWHISSGTYVVPCTHFDRNYYCRSLFGSDHQPKPSFYRPLNIVDGKVDDSDARKFLGENSCVYNLVFGTNVAPSAVKASCPSCPTAWSAQAHEISGLGRVIEFTIQRNLGGLGYAGLGVAEQNVGNKEGQEEETAGQIRGYPSGWKWYGCQLTEDHDRKKIDPRNLMPSLFGLTKAESGPEFVDGDGIDLSSSPSSPSSRRTFEQLIDILSATTASSTDLTDLLYKFRLP
ncbi:hypothetical protein V8F20_008312 [Naviculisporaceae sp. PSN 640]